MVAQIHSLERIGPDDVLWNTLRTPYNPLSEQCQLDLEQNIFIALGRANTKDQVPLAVSLAQTEYRVSLAQQISHYQKREVLKKSRDKTIEIAVEQFLHDHQ